jgi:hypothetical protein
VRFRDCHELLPPLCGALAAGGVPTCAEESGLVTASAEYCGWSVPKHYRSRCFGVLFHIKHPSNRAALEAIFSIYTDIEDQRDQSIVFILVERNPYEGIHPRSQNTSDPRGIYLIAVRAYTSRTSYSHLVCKSRRESCDRHLSCSFCLGSRCRGGDSRLRVWQETRALSCSSATVA